MIGGLLVMCLLWLMPQSPDSELHPGSKAPAWSLKDANDVSYQSSSLAGKTVILIGGDKKSQDSNIAWAARIKASCGGGVTGIGVADVSAAPRLLRGLYRNQIRADAARMGVPVLLDWDGAVSRSFHFKADVSNVLVITQAGFIVYSFAGPVTEDGVKGACAAAGKVSP